MNHSDIAALMKGAAPVIRDYVAGAVQPLLLQIETMQKEIDTLKAKHVDPDDLDSRLKEFSALMKDERDKAKADGKEKRQVVVADLKAGILAECETKMSAMIAAIPAPKDGKDADVADVAAMVTAGILPELRELRGKVEALPAPVELPDIPSMVAEAVKAIPAPKDGVSVTLDDVTPMIKAEVERLGAGLPDIGVMVREAVDKIPEGIDGKDADLEVIKQMVAAGVAALPPAEKGKDADPVEVAALVAREAERILSGWDRPQDGKSVSLDEARPLIDEAVTKAVTLIPVPKDGVDGKDGRDGLDVVKFIRDDRGHLNGILRDGTTVDLGEYVGKDGARGEPGKDGADAVGFDDMDLLDTEQGVVLRFTRGEVVKDFRLPIVTDRGVFKEGTEYHKGDGVTWGGSFWIAQETTGDKPDSGNGWRLAVKRGRDGKDPKPPTKPGPVKVG